MTDGRRWLALDADLFGKRFTDDLYNQFGWAGIVTWVAFLCACKQGRVQGQIRVMNDVQALHKLGLAGWDLVDNDGNPWTLTDFWTFTGRKKQTRRIPVGRSDARRQTNTDRTATRQCFDVVPTHWQHWQHAAGRAREAERMRTSRAQKRPGKTERAANMARTNVGPDSDLDSDIPPTPRRAGGSGRRFASNGKGQTPTARPVPEWQPDPDPDTTIDPATAIGALRTERGWGNTKAGGEATT